MSRIARRPLIILLFSTVAIVVWSQATPNFSGSWKQDNDRCQPKRNGDVTLTIEQHDPKLSVETTIARNSGTVRHAIQSYTTDGKVSVSTGADGDEFHTSVVQKDSTLAFSIEEREDGHVRPSKETWSIIEDGATLRRIRERADGDKQTLLYRRVDASRSESNPEATKVSAR